MIRPTGARSEPPGDSAAVVVVSPPDPAVVLVVLAVPPPPHAATIRARTARRAANVQCLLIIPPVGWWVMPSDRTSEADDGDVQRGSRIAPARSAPGPPRTDHRSGRRCAVPRPTELPAAP